jgi:hypothetical protein
LSVQINPSIGKQCGSCKQLPPSEKLLKVCSKCKSAYYCSVECQRQAWATHKTVCNPLVKKEVSLLSSPTNPVLEGKANPPSLPQTTSGYLRFLNIWLDAYKRGLTGLRKEIIILGPGCQQLGNSDHCPQVAEAERLWDQSHFTTLDCNPNVLDVVRPLDYELSKKFIIKTFEINRVSHPDLTKEVEKLKSLLIKSPFGENRLTRKVFTMGVDSPASLPNADLILATYSLFYPMQALRMADKDRDRQQRITLFSQYLAKLKKSGVLYIEKDCLSAILSQAEHSQNEEYDDAILQNLPSLLTQLQNQFGIDVQLHSLPMATKPSIEDVDQFCVLQPETADIQRMTRTNSAFAFIRQ